MASNLTIDSLLRIIDFADATLMVQWFADSISMDPVVSVVISVVLSKCSGPTPS